MLIGALLAGGSTAVLVHNETAIKPEPARVLFNYGSG
jgi:hypothetical protein